MLRATAVVRRPAVKAERVVDTLALDHEARRRRSMALTADGGLEVLLDLDRATTLEDGDALKLEDGRLVRVRAAPERLIEIRTDNPLRLMKVAWHIGNRHVAAELAEDAIYVAHDEAHMEMVRGLGAIATVIERPFRPERGIEAEGHSHGHHHHGHDHGHGHHEHASNHDHVHGHGADGHGSHEHGGEEHGAHGHHAHTPADCAHEHGHASHEHDHGRDRAGHR